MESARKEYMSLFRADAASLGSLSGHLIDLMGPLSNKSIPLAQHENTRNYGLIRVSLALDSKL